MTPRLLTIAASIFLVLVAKATADPPATSRPATDTEAQMKLAEAMELAYQRGQITAEEFAPAAAIYQRAAKAGNVEAMYSLACCYYAGKGVDVDVSAALKWLAAMANRRHKDAHHFRFDLLYGQFEIGRARREDFKPIADEWKTLALASDPQAMARYGLMLEYGLGGVKMDKAEAAKMYQAAAKKGNPLATYRLGRMYWSGLGGLAKDPALGLKQIQRAADADCAPALRFVGRMHLFGKNGIKKDVGKGFKYVLRAAGLGHIPSMDEVAESLYFGDLGKPDYAGALEWATRSASLRSARGQYRLGMIHLNGKGVPVDHARAVRYFLPAADTGYARAAFKLGNCFEAGWGVDPDRTEAVAWYRRAAQRGHEGAKKRLAKLGVKP